MFGHRNPAVAIQFAVSMVATAVSLATSISQLLLPAFGGADEAGVDSGDEAPSSDEDTSAASAVRRPRLECP